jgi:hypothetical protein
MQQVSFTTLAPFDHVQRALDSLRSMGFALETLAVENVGDALYRVDIRYRPQGSLSPQTFVTRLAFRSGLHIIDPHSNGAGPLAARG